MSAEKLKLPKEVIDAGWRDEAEINSEEIDDLFEFHPKDGEYIDPDSVKCETAKKAKDKIIEFRRRKFGKRGMVVNRVLSEKLAA